MLTASRPNRNHCHEVEFFREISNLLNVSRIAARDNIAGLLAEEGQRCPLGIQMNSCTYSLRESRFSQSYREAAIGYVSCGGEQAITGE